MRLGSLLLQICAVLIAGALIAGGYVYYQERKVANWRELLEQVEWNSLNSFVAALAAAPSMKCTESYSDFNRAAITTSYHDKGRTRIVFNNITSPKESQNWLIEGSVIYIWGEAYENIVRADLSSANAPLSFEQAASLFQSAQCSVWWNPNEDAFRLPGDKPIIDA